MGLFSAIGGLARGVGSLVKKAAPVAAGLLGGPAGIAAGAAAGLLTRGSAPRPSVPALPTLSRTSLAAPPLPQQRQPGVVGAVRRALPGGRSGYAYDPYDLNTPRDKLGRPVATHIEVRERITCAPGYVSVDLDGDGVKDACVLKGVARAMGLYRGRPRPPVTGYEARAIRTASAVKKRVASLARSTGLYVAAKKPQGGGGKKK